VSANCGYAVAQVVSLVSFGDRSRPLEPAESQCLVHVGVHGRLRAVCEAFWMQTTGACQVGTSSAAHKRCLWSCMRAVVRRRCCTFCCTALTLARQGNSVRLPLVRTRSTGVGLFVPKPARVTWFTTALTQLTCLGLSVDIRWRPLVSVAVVTHLVAHPPKRTQYKGGPAVIPSRSHG
jgi:hypothetical protein